MRADPLIAGSPKVRRLRSRAPAAALAAAFVAAMVSAFFPALAWGHALMTAADPAPGSNLGTAPAAVTLTFTERPDPQLSSITVLDASGKPVTSGKVQAVPSNPRQLRVSLQKLGKGVYTVSWRTVSAVDGHLASGSYGFGVDASPPTSGASQGSASNAGEGTLSPIAVLGRWLLLLGLIGLLGAAYVALAIHTVPRGRVLRILAVAWGLAAIGTFVVIGDQMADAGIGPWQLLGTSLGSAALLRLGALALAAIGLAAVARTSVPERLAIWVVAAGAGAGMLAEALTSHAAASDNAIFDVGVQLVHLAAVGLWMGGLAMLLLTLAARPSDATARAAARYAWTATAGIAIVSITGVLRAISELNALEQLVTTAFGLLLIAKSLLLLCIAGLGAINHFRNVPMAGRSLTGLRRIGSAELVIGASLLVLSASLVNLAPPASASSGRGSQLQALEAGGADFGTTVRVRLEVAPGLPGFNTFLLSVTDYDTGAPINGAVVTLRFALPSRPDVGSSRLMLKPASSGASGGSSPGARGSSTRPGTYAGTGANLSLPGTWTITAVVTQHGTTVEIPLRLTTRPTPSPTVDVVRASGLPTIYTVHLDQGRTAQIYLDPGHAGADEVHVTFFDAQGKELPVPAATMSVQQGSAAPRVLKARILEPGHFVADTRLTAGTVTLNVSGTAPDGAQITVQLDVEVLP